MKKTSSLWKQRLDQLFQSQYRKLKVQARFKVRNVPDSIISPTGLVSEIYPQMAAAVGDPSLSTKHFHNIAGQAMKFSLIDHLRKKGAAVHGGHLNSVPIEDWHGISDSFERSLMTRDLIEKLRAVDEQCADILVGRYINGLENSQIAEHTQLSLATVERRMKFAKAWIRANWSGD